MNVYVVRRILMLSPVLFGVSILVFGLIHFIPGDIAVALLANAESANTRVDRERIREFFGRNRPLHEQFLTRSWNAVREDLCRSFWTNEPVAK